MQDIRDGETFEIDALSTQGILESLEVEANEFLRPGRIAGANRTHDTAMCATGMQGQLYRAQPDIHGADEPLHGLHHEQQRPVVGGGGKGDMEPCVRCCLVAFARFLRAQQLVQAIQFCFRRVAGVNC